MKEIMSYETFREAITGGIMDHLPEEFSDYSVRIDTVRKTNETKETMSVIPTGVRMAAIPNIYLDDAYEAYKNGNDIEEILRNIAVAVALAKPVEEDFLEELIRKDKIVLNLINRRKNETMLMDIPHETYLDLAVVYRIIISSDDEGLYTVLINNALMEKMGWTKEEIQEAAHENTRRLYPLETVDMSGRLYMITNVDSVYGAAMILYEETKEMLKERIKDSFYIIPSSIHESATRFAA